MISLYACFVIRHWDEERERERERERESSLDMRRGAGSSAARVNAPL